MAQDRLSPGKRELGFYRPTVLWTGWGCSPGPASLALPACPSLSTHSPWPGGASDRERQGLAGGGRRGQGLSGGVCPGPASSTPAHCRALSHFATLTCRPLWARPAVGCAARGQPLPPGSCGCLGGLGAWSPPPLSGTIHEAQCLPQLPQTMSPHP